MRKESFFLSVLLVFVPFIFAVNLLRYVSTGDISNYIGLQGLLRILSTMSVSASKVYFTISNAVMAFGDIPLLNIVFNPLQFIADVASAVWQLTFGVIQIFVEFFRLIVVCCQVFFDLVGFIPA